MTKIYCDEAGNSGANLLDKEQPFFVLASNDFSTDEAASLLEHVRSAQGAEPKFTALKKSKAGVSRLIRLLSDPRLNKDRVAANVFHKQFMVITKLVDLIAETLIYKIGGDLYERGANLAMSNMLFYCLPVFCGQENTDRFLATFVEMIRRPEQDHITAFYDAGRMLIDSSKSEDFEKDLFYFTEPHLFHVWFNDAIDSLALDPAIPALFQHIATWGARREDRFDVVHDSSKPILASQETFEKMMALSNEPSSEIGYDRRKFRFPLRAQSLTQADSTAHPQLQIADLCAGIVNHISKCRIANELDELAKAAINLGAVKWIVDGVMPSPDVTPEGLGTDEVSGTNPVDGMVSYLSKRRS
ncbi:DUF3800 domain-containing protein [Variovorax sp. YR216]|uniref:DUF3800 domain-containing protein n=1 Tax=Variovorax sp. YR216 TaxID=1882828 RepID=UPI000897DFFF|nr:DUF3800 domain-containing protein [Variovorax sp. YR216]SEA67684.1 Protein of unknown function [Variovorax sp. YR216]